MRRVQRSFSTWSGPISRRSSKLQSARARINRLHDSRWRSGRSPRADREIALTARESEVLSLLAEGESNKSIARRLDISVHTAKFHVAAVLAKLGARNRSDAVAIGMRRGLVLL